MINSSRFVHDVLTPDSNGKCLTKFKSFPRKRESRKYCFIAAKDTCLRGYDRLKQVSLKPVPAID
jgi:hypothetical protein